MKARVFGSFFTMLLACEICGAAEHTKDSLDTVKANLAGKKAVLIDVRELKEWNEGHLQDAQFVPLSELKRMATDPAIQQKIEKSLPRNRIIYCHCRSGVRSLTAGELLGKLGYDVRPLAAGHDDLRDAGFAAAKK